MFYHSEPFEVACNLAEQQLDLSKHREEYEEILRQHGWVEGKSIVASEPVLTR
jgi:hypothetical protein